jgi:hypothetical protein
MEHIEPARLPRDPPAVPRRVTRDRRSSSVTAERERSDLESRATFESALEAADDARRTGSGLHERRNIQADPHNTPS